MIENTILTQFLVEPIDPSLVLSSEPGEKAYSLKSIHHGECKNEEEEQSKLAEAEVTPNTLGFELDFEVDMYPYELVTYTANKQINAHFEWGDHAPGEKNYQEKCQFKPGDKVLCVIHSGYDAVIPAIVVEPLDEQYVIQLYKEALEEGYGVPDTFEEFLETYYDWDWDAVIVRPLVRLKTDWEEMGETEAIQRVYLFPYKTSKYMTKI